MRRQETAEPFLTNNLLTPFRHHSHCTCCLLIVHHTAYTPPPCTTLQKSGAGVCAQGFAFLQHHEQMSSRRVFRPPQVHMPCALVQPTSIIVRVRVVFARMQSSHRDYIGMLHDGHDACVWPFRVEVGSSASASLSRSGAQRVPRPQARCRPSACRCAPPLLPCCLRRACCLLWCVTHPPCPCQCTLVFLASVISSVEYLDPPPYPSPLAPPSSSSFSIFSLRAAIPALASGLPTGFCSVAFDSSASAQVHGERSSSSGCSAQWQRGCRGWSR